MDNLELKKRYDALYADRHNVEGVWNRIEQFVVPYRGTFFRSNTGESEVDWRKREIFDSTAIIANQNLAANIHSNVTNPLIQWFDMKFRRTAVNAMHEAKIWIEEVVELIFLALQESNFNLEVNELYLDLSSFGTSFMGEEVVENDDSTFKNLDFECLPLFESYFECDTRGRVINYYRKLSWTPLQIKDKFGDKIPDSVKEKCALSTSGTIRMPIIHAIFTREEAKNADTFNQLIPTARPFGSKYFLYEGMELLGEEGGYYEMPVYTPRWRKTAGSEWGHSPAMVCISDILTLQQLVELILKSAEKAVDPPIITTRRGVFGDVDLNPAGVTVVADMKSIAPFESKARFDVSHLEKQQLQDSINRTFFMDQLQLKESPAMTATEVNVRFQLMQRLLGPTLGRLQSDFLDPLIERTFKILYRYRMLPPMPDALIQAGAELEIEYLGTMARSQKYDEVASTERWIGNVTAMSEVFPEVVDIVDADTTVRDLGLSMGVPSVNMKSRDVVKRIRDDRKKKQAMAEALEIARAGGDAMKSLGEGGQALNEQKTIGNA